MRQSIYFLIILFAFTACKKDDDNHSSGNNNTPNPEASYENPQLSGINSSADFFGRITSRNGDIIEGALVEIGNKSTSTNEFGFYQIDNAVVDQEYAVIEVTAPTYFKQFRSFNPKETVLNMQDIQMIPQVFTGAFQSATGGTIQLPGGGQVIFQAGDLVSPDGSAYSGQVAVATAYLDPTDPTLSSYLPGSLLAVNTDDDLAVMITYGMAGVELYGSNGEILQLGDDVTASLEMPIQAEQMAHAPESIPLWFFDETNGIWREDGVANKTGDKYVGDVSHFTFWNCDYPYELATIQGTVLVDNENYDLGNMYVRIELSNGSSAVGNVSSNGSFSGLVPANEVLTVSIEAIQCNLLIVSNSASVPPIGTNQIYDMGDIDLGQIDELEVTTFNATIVDCEGIAQSGLIVDIEHVGFEFYSVSNDLGQISFTIPCISGNLISYRIINMDEVLVSVPDMLDFSPAGENHYDLGELAYCETEPVAELFTYSEGSNSVTMLNVVAASLEGQYVYLESQGLFMDNELENISIFYVESPFQSGAGPGAFFTGETNEQGVYYQLDNGNYYKALYDIDLSDVYINDVEFLDEYNLERIEVTITGPVNVSIYNQLGSSTPISEYTSTATSHFYYWPE